MTSTPSSPGGTPGSPDGSRRVGHRAGASAALADNDGHGVFAYPVTYAMGSVHPFAIALALALNRHLRTFNLNPLPFNIDRHHLGGRRQPAGRSLGPEQPHAQGAAADRADRLRGDRDEHHGPAGGHRAAGGEHVVDDDEPPTIEVDALLTYSQREMLQAAIDHSQRWVTGEVTVKLYKGTAYLIGRSSPSRPSASTSAARFAPPLTSSP